MKTMIYFPFQDGKSKAGKILLLVILIALPLLSVAQNVGIGTDTPTEKLQVAGKVFASQEGFKFPDGSVQTRAYNAYESQDACDPRWIVILDINGIDGSFSYGTHLNKIKVTDVDWGSYFNIDEVTPVTTGCHFKLMKITKDIDKSSPKLFEKFNTGQVLNPVILYFLWYNDTTQTYVDYYKITLTHVYVAKFDEQVRYIGNDSYAHLDVVSFIYDLTGGGVTLYWYGPPVVQGAIAPGGCHNPVK
jgi:type VI secretion system Hcp family effector